MTKEQLKADNLYLKTQLEAKQMECAELRNKIRDINDRMTVSGGYCVRDETGFPTFTDSNEIADAISESNRARNPLYPSGAIYVSKRR